MFKLYIFKKSIIIKYKLIFIKLAWYLIKTDYIFSFYIRPTLNCHTLIGNITAIVVNQTGKKVTLKNSAICNGKLLITSLPITKSYKLQKVHLKFYTFFIDSRPHLMDTYEYKTISFLLCIGVECSCFDQIWLLVLNYYTISN